MMYTLILSSLLFLAPQGNSQKITMVVADQCGFIVKGTAQVTATVLMGSPFVVASIQMDVDGMPVGPLLTMPPYQFAWDTTPLTNGCHTISATASDSGGNSGTVSMPVSVKNNK